MKMTNEYEITGDFKVFIKAEDEKEAMKLFTDMMKDYGIQANVKDIEDWGELVE